MNINYELVIYILKFIKFEMLDRTKPVAKDILLKFEDNGVNKAQCAFLKNHLDNYKLYLDSKYSMKSDTEYDESKEILLIGITITIPNRLIPKKNDKLTKIVMDLKQGFQNFYEQTIQSFKQ
jgi:hypothetical protein